MRNSEYINELDIRKAIAQLIPEGNVFEVRIIRNSKSKPLSGYFRDADTLMRALDTVDLRKSNVYITLQEINQDCYSRIQCDRFVENAQATGDGDIVAYNWLFIDIDPVRTSGVSSSEEELKGAHRTAKIVEAFMTSWGFYEPIKALSGNGVHLLYGISLNNNEENKQLITKCLEVLDELFSTEKIKIDTVNFNPARICKLYGTLAQKGANNSLRPHRMSAMVGDVKTVQVNKKTFLEKLAGMAPEEEKPTPAHYNNFVPSEFDIEQWMMSHGIGYKKQPYRDGSKFVLDVCPFDSSHRAPDSTIFKLGNGAIGFRCLHNSCRDKTWRDVRIKFEPDAYDKKQLEVDDHIEIGWSKRNRDKNNIPYQNVQSESNEPKFLTMQQIMDLDEPEYEYIKTGIRTIDVKMKGLQKSAVSVVSGLRGAAKSTILSQIMLNAVEAGQNVICYSGELTSKNFWNWISKQAAGKNHITESGKYQHHYELDSLDTAKKIALWMGEHLWLYNNNFGNRFEKIAEELKRIVAEKKADLVVIDNMMALDLAKDKEDANTAQTRFVWALKDIAKICNVHVIFVAHPRKSDGFLRLNDIAGSGNIANIVDNAFIVHRNNADFKRLTQQMFKWPNDHEAYAGTNVIEIVKDRENGNQDVFIPLWYEAKTKRLNNTENEYIQYSWEKVEKEEDEEDIF